MSLYTYNVAYNQGYSRALLDVKNWIEKHSISLKQNKMFNEKGIIALLKAMGDNEETFEKYGDETEFTVTSDKRVVLGEN